MKSASRRKGTTYKSQKREAFRQESVRRMTQFLEQTQYQISNSNIIHQKSRNFEKPIHRPPVIQESTSWAKHLARARKMSTAHTQTTYSSVGQRGICPEIGQGKHGIRHWQKLSLWLGRANKATASQH